MYASETNIDVAVGISIATLWGTAFTLNLIAPQLMLETVLGPSKTFFLFSFLSCFGAVYSYRFIIETKGLTDK